MDERWSARRAVDDPSRKVSKEWTTSRDSVLAVLIREATKHARRELGPEFPTGSY